MMNLVQELQNKFQDLKKTLTKQEQRKDDQQHVMTEDEKLDEAIEESFPASDSPGHFSKSIEDKESHRPH